MKGTIGIRLRARKEKNKKKIMKSIISPGIELIFFLIHFVCIHVLKLRLSAGDAGLTVLRLEADSCHVSDLLLDCSQENRSFATTERSRAAFFVSGTADQRTFIPRRRPESVTN